MEEQAPGRRLSGATLVLAVVLALHVAYAVGDRTWWGEWFAVWPPIGWLVLALPSLVRFRARLGAALPVLLVALRSDWPRPGASPAPRQRLRVVSWNVAGEAGALKHLRTMDPDLVLVQEAAGRPEGWSGYHWHGTFDPSILSRFPLAAEPTRKVGPWIEPELVLATLPGGRRLLVANVRLVLPSVVTWVASGFRDDPFAGHSTRAAQLPALAALLQETMQRTGVPTAVLCGDFNAPAALPSADALRAFLVDAWRAAGRGWPGTATADLPLARIDQCWATPDLVPVSARVYRLAASDHRALVVDFDLAQPGRPLVPEK